MTDLRKLAEAATRPITGFPGYCADAAGVIWSDSGWRGHECRALVPETDRYGYQKVRLVVDGRRRRVAVHTLIALAFHGERPAGAQVRHLNGRRDDNRAENLAWGSASENAADREQHGTTARGERNGFARLTDDEVRRVRGLLATGRSQRAVAALVGCSQRTVGAIARNERWAHV